MAQDQEVGSPRAPTAAQTTSSDRTDEGGRGGASGLERLQAAIAQLVGRVKRLRGPIIAIAAVGAALNGLVGYWNAHRPFITAGRPHDQTESPSLFALVRPRRSA